MGYETIFNYKLLTDKSTNAPYFHNKGSDATYPQNSIQPAIYAIHKITVPNGVGGDNITTFRYENAKLHRGGRGFLGFEKIIAENNISSQQAVTLYEIKTPYYVPVPKSVTATLFNGTPLSSESSSVTLNGVGNPLQKRFDVKIASSFQQNHIHNTFTGSLNIYDNFGNIYNSISSINIYTSLFEIKIFPQNCICS